MDKKGYWLDIINFEKNTKKFIISKKDKRVQKENCMKNILTTDI